MKFLTIPVFVAFAFIPLPGGQDGHAQACESHMAMCMDHRALVIFLQERLGQTQQGVGVAANQGFAELFASPRGAWSWVKTDARQISCIEDAGNRWGGPNPAKEGK